MGHVLAFSRDSRLLITAGPDHKAKLWDVASARELRSLDWGSLGPSDAAFSPDGQMVAFSRAGAIHLWSPALGGPPRRLRSSNITVEELAFSPSGDALASRGSFSAGLAFFPALSLWDPQTGREERSIPLVKSGQGLAFSPDGRVVATGESGQPLGLGEPGTVTLAEPSTGRVLARLDAHHNPVWSVAFSPDGSVLAAAAGTTTPSMGSITLFEVDSARRLRVITAESLLRDVTFTPDGRLVVAGSHDGTVRVWEVATARAVHLGRPGGKVARLALSPDGRTLGVTTFDGVVSLCPLQRLLGG